MRRNAVGWLMLLAGTLYLVATAAGSVVYLRLADGDTGAGTRALTGVFTTVWMPAIAVLIPLAVQLFPTGRPINRFWAGYAVATAIGGVVATLDWVLGPEVFSGMGVGPDALVPGGPPGWLVPVLAVLRPLGVLAIAGAVLTPAFRLLRRPGEERLQVSGVEGAAGAVLSRVKLTAAPVKV